MDLSPPRTTSSDGVQTGLLVRPGRLDDFLARNNLHPLLPRRRCCVSMIFDPTSTLRALGEPSLQSRPRAPHLHPLGIPSHFPACLQEFFSLILSLPLPPSQALGGQWRAGRPPCGPSRSPPCGSLPTFVGGQDTFSARWTRMHFVWLCCVHVVPSSSCAVSSIRVASCHACRSARAAVGACCN